MRRTTLHALKLASVAAAMLAVHQAAGQAMPDIGFASVGRGA